MKLSSFVLRSLLILSLLLQVACLGTTPPSQFYLLEPLAETEAMLANANAAKITLALSPVRIPHYLDRPQIVTAAGKNTYQLDEFHRWAESLGDNMTRVMLQDLTVIVPADVVMSTTSRAKQADFHLSVNILEFYIDPQDQARLSAQWQVSKGKDVVLSQNTAYQVPAGNDDVQLKIEALNQCLNLLNRDIAAAIKTISVH
jgi:uncharacterized protein